MNKSRRNVISIGSSQFFFSFHCIATSVGLVGTNFALEISQPRIQVMNFCCLNLQVELGWKGYDSGGQDTCSAEPYQFTKSTVRSFSIIQLNTQLSLVLADSLNHILDIRT